MATAWILPGGASFGAIQAGVATALLEQGVMPDLVVGASIGAINAALVAADPTQAGAAEMCRLWTSIKRQDVLPLRAGPLLRGLLGRSNHLIPNDRLGCWLRDNMPVELIEDTPVRLAVTASDLVSAEPVYLQRGDLVGALLASTAIPGMLPPVRIGGRWLVDGWVLANAPLGWVARAGVDTIYVLPCGGTRSYHGTAPMTMLARLVTDASSRARVLAEHGLPRGGAAINQELVAALVARTIRQEFLAWTPRVDVYLPPAPNVRRLSMMAFAEAPRLMDAAYQLANRWLPDARPLTPYDVVEPHALSGVND
ncbi:MAG TPA: patatin-like phospholipase family protein [Micromonosporaceae bacterium]|nr:patatin-like phospholipase family protein [Micromonosporaceae bacterium]